MISIGDRLCGGRGRGGSAAMVALILALAGAACARTDSPAAPAAAGDPALASTIANVVQTGMAKAQLRAVIVKVTRGDQVLIRQAFGPSMDGVRATPDMRFRNGAIAFAYVATLLLQFVDEHKVTLDDTIDRWMPTLPEAHAVTLRMLVNQTTGYPDYETDPAWLAAFNADPFHIWTYDERMRYAFSRPIQFPPGTNWSYAHTNFMILGEVLAKIGGQPLDALLEQKVLGPMGLTNTTQTESSQVPDPVLHTYSGERRPALGVPASDITFSEEATYWNTQWGTPIGANQTTSIDDLVTTAVAVGTGSLLSKASYEAMTAPSLLGFGHKDPGCEPSCFTQIPVYNYGLGVVRSGSWILQNPQLSGFSATEAYLSSEKVAIAVAVTYLPQAFDAQGNFANSSDSLFRAIGAVVAQKDPPPPLPTS